MCEFLIWVTEEVLVSQLHNVFEMHCPRVRDMGCNQHACFEQEQWLLPTIREYYVGFSKNNKCSHSVLKFRGWDPAKLSFQCYSGLNASYQYVAVCGAFDCTCGK